MEKIFICLLTAIACGFNYGGKPFEGKISYTVIKAEGLEENTLKKWKKILYIKGNKTRQEFNTNGCNTITVWDFKRKDYVLLSYCSGEKLRMFKYKIGVTVTGKKTVEPLIEYLSGTKTIAGYICNKAYINLGKGINEDKQLTADVYYTTQLPYYSESDMFHGLKGFPMEYQMRTNGRITENIIAISVSKESVPDSLFNIPKEN